MSDRFDTDDDQRPACDCRVSDATPPDVTLAFKVAEHFGARLTPVVLADKSGIHVITRPPLSDEERGALESAAALLGVYFANLTTRIDLERDDDGE